tara:strand:- start:19196 stop:32497 length:13302 start_codon:yes stop_codon:yes gene_type:complete
MSDPVDPKPIETPKPFSEWSSTIDNDPMEFGGQREDEISKKLRYSNYLRESYVESGGYTVDLEQQIRQGLYNELVSDGYLEDGDLDTFSTYFESPEISLETKINSVKESEAVDFFDPIRDQIRQYEAVDKLVTDLEGTEDLADTTVAKRDELRARLGEDIKYSFSNIQERSVNSRELPFARLSHSDGTTSIKAGKLAEDMSFTEDEKGNRVFNPAGFLTALRQSKANGVQMSDALVARALLERQQGTNVPVYQAQNLVTLYNVIVEKLKTDEQLQESVEGHSNRAAFLLDKNVDGLLNKYVLRELDQLATPFKDAGQLAMDFIGKASPLVEDNPQLKNKQEARRRLAIAERQKVPFIINKLRRDIVESGVLPVEDFYSDEDMILAYRQVVLDHAHNSGKFNFDNKNLSNNILTNGFRGPLAHRGILYRKSAFEQAVAEKKGLTEDYKEILVNQRKALTTQEYPRINELLLRDATNQADDWSEFSTSRIAKGKKGPEILEEFLDDPDNYDKFKRGNEGLISIGVGQSVVDAFTNLVEVAPNLVAYGLDNVGGYLPGDPRLGKFVPFRKLTTKALDKQADDAADRQEIAYLFGEKVSAGQIALQTIAPVIVDMTATAVLTIATGGTGGVLYAGGKSVATGAARMSVKGMLKGLSGRSTLRTIKTSGTKGLEAAAERAVAAGLIKESVKTGGRDGVMKTLKAYNNTVAQRAGLTGAVFTTAANRASAATFGTLYNQIQASDPSLTEQEVFDMAMGPTLVVGSITGAVTGAFTFAGAGAIDDAFARGMTYKGLENLIRSLGNTGNYSREAIKRAVTKQVEIGIKKYASGTKGVKEFIKGPVKGTLLSAGFEGAEESIQDFAATFVEDAALNRDTPMIDRLRHTALSFTIGAAFGAGAPVAFKGGPAAARRLFNRGELPTTTLQELDETQAVADEFREGVIKRLEEAGSPEAAAEFAETYDKRVRTRGKVVAPAPDPTTETLTAEGDTPTEFGPKFTVKEIRTGEDIDRRDAEYEEWLSGIDLGEEGQVEIPLDPEHYFRGAKEGVTITLVINENVSGQNADGSWTPVRKARIVVRNPDGTGGVNKFGQGDFYRDTVKLLSDSAASAAAPATTTIDFTSSTTEETPTETLPVRTETGRTRMVETPQGGLEVTVPPDQGFNQPGTLGTGALFVEQTTEEEADQLLSELQNTLPETFRRLFDLEEIGANRTTADGPVGINLQIINPDQQGELFGQLDFSSLRGTENVDADKIRRQEKARIQDINRSEISQKTQQVAEGLGKPERRAVRPKLTPYTTLPFLVTARAGRRKLKIDTAPFRSGDKLTAKEKEEVKAVDDLARDTGYPVRFHNSAKFGVPMTKNLAEKSEYLGATVYSYYPVLPISRGEKGESFFSTPTKKRFFNPLTGKTKKKGEKVKARIDRDGYGIFNNDPIVVAALLSAKKQVPIPEDFDMDLLNPAIVPEDGFAVDVLRPVLGTLSSDGKQHLLLESAVTQVHKMGPVVLNTNRNNNVRNILSLFVDAKDTGDRLYPDTVYAVDAKTGATSSKSRVTFKELYRSLSDLVDTALKDDRSAARRLLQRGINGANIDDDNVSTVANALITEHEYLARLYDLRSQLQTTSEPAEGGTRVVAPTKSKRKAAVNKLKNQLREGVPLDQFANRALKVLPSGLDSEQTTEDIIVEFINNEVLSNPKFDSGVMPEVYATALSVKGRYVEQEKTRGLHEIARSQIALGAEEGGLQQGALAGFGDSTDTALEFRSSAETELSRREEQEEVRSLLGPKDLGPLSPEISITGQDYGNLTAATIDRILSVLDSAPDGKLRAALNDLAFKGLYSGQEQQRQKQVQGQTARDLMLDIAGWIQAGNHENPEALNFLKNISELESAQDLKDAFYLTSLSYQAEGDLSEDSKVVDEMVRLIEKYTPELFNRMGDATTTQNIPDPSGERGADGRVRQITVVRPKLKSRRDIAKQFLKGNNQSILERSSRGYIEEALRREAEIQNLLDVDRLGLVSGDPESVVDAVRNIKKESSNPNHRLVAELLLEDTNFMGSVEFIMDSNESAFAGTYNTLTDGTRVVSINLATGNGRGLENVLLEEYTHAFLAEVLNKPESDLTDFQRSALTRLRNLYDNAKKSYVEKGKANPILDAGLENIDEFVAHFLLSPEFQKYVVDLPAQGNQNIFQRLVSIFAGLFRKVTNRESKKYVEALQDILDLGRSTYLQNEKDIKAMGAAVAYNSGVVVRRATQRQFAQGADEFESAIPQRAVRLYSPAKSEPSESEVEEILGDSVDTLTTNLDEQAALESAVATLRASAPYGMPIAEGKPEQGSAVMFADVESNTLFVDLEGLAETVSAMDPRAASLYVRSILSEEVIHTGGYNSLTQGQVEAVMSELSEEQYQEIAEEYLGRELTEEELANPEQRQILAEEKLRMVVQKVLRGFTTEQDYEFFSQNPTSFQILKRYVLAGLRSGARNTKNLGGSMEAAVNLMLTEYRAMERGFVREAVPVLRSRPLAKIVFDASNPQSSVQRYVDFQEKNTLEDILRSDVRRAHADRTADRFATSAHNFLWSDRNLPPRGAKVTKNEEVGSYIEELAMEFWGRKLTSKDITPEEIELITQVGVDEFEAAFHASGKNASDWYSTSIEIAMQVAAVLHPELANSELAVTFKGFETADDPAAAADLTMRIALAITSQNLTVALNTRFAEEQYQIFRETGRFDPSKAESTLDEDGKKVGGYGEKSPSIASNLNLANQFIDRYGFAELEAFLTRDIKVPDLEKLIEQVTGRKASIEGTKEETVQGAAIFGPKIGQGFLQNIMGIFDPVTVDLWMRRTWGRWTGDVVGSGTTDRQLAKLIDAAREYGIKLDPVISKLRPINRSNKTDGTYRSMSDAVMKRLETDEEFGSAVIKFAKELKKISERHFKLTQTPMSGFELGKFRSGKPLTHKEFIRAKEKEAREIDRAFEKAKPRLAKVRKQLEADFKAGTIDEETFNARKAKTLKAGFTQDWYVANNKDLLMDKNERNAFKPAWALAASRIADSVKPIDVPTPQDRRVISAVVNDIRKRLEKRGYRVTNADVQAVLWYPEKDIWERIKGRKDSSLKSSYDEEFIKLAKLRGLGEEAESAARSVQRDKSRRTSRDSGAVDGQSTGGVRGGAVQLSSPVKRTGRLTGARTRYRSGRGSSQEDRRVSLSAEDFSAAALANKEANKFGTSVDVLSPQEYDGYDLILLEKDGETTTISISPDGEVGSVTKSAGATTEMVLDAFEIATETNKVKWLNGFDTVLPDIYGKLGFKAVARLGFNPEFAPEGWDAERYARFNAGAPDVVFMRYVGKPTQYFAGQGDYVSDYNEAVVKTLEEVPLQLRSPVKRPSSGGMFQDVIDQIDVPLAMVASERADRSKALIRRGKPRTNIFETTWDFLLRITQGDIATPYRKIVEARDQMNKALGVVAPIAYAKELKLIIKEDFDNEVPIGLIAQAQGYVDGSLVPDSVLDQIEQEYIDDLEFAQNLERGSLTRQEHRDEKQALRDIAKEEREEKTREAYKEAVEKVNQDRLRALASLERSHPAKVRSWSRGRKVSLASHIIEIREDLINPLQEKLIEAGVSPEIGIRISDTADIYLTRAYRMFTEVGFLDKVRSDPEFAEVRDAAQEYFAEDYVRQRTDFHVKKGMDFHEAQVLANEELDNNPKIAEDTYQAFLQQYEPGAGLSESTRSDLRQSIDNLRKRTDLPKPVRDLLGEYGPEVGTDLTLRTLSTVSHITSQQVFLNQIRDYGLESKSMVTTKERYESVKEFGKESPYYDWRPVRSTTETSKTATAQARGASDPLRDLYAPAALVTGLNQALSGVSTAGVTDTATQAMDLFSRGFRFTTGLGMLLKTHPNPGFHTRNAMGSYFFLLAQGGFKASDFYKKDSVFVQTFSRTVSDVKSLRTKLGRDVVDAELIELANLGIFRDELRAGVLQDLVLGEESLGAALEKLHEQESVLAKGKKGASVATERVIEISAAIDAAVKIVAYNRELEFLEQSAAKYPEGRNATLGLEGRKRAAADKIKMTYQSYSQSMPIVDAFRNNMVSNLFGPFIRFRTEIPRIVHNTYILGARELTQGIQDGDTIMAKRGGSRIGAMTSMLGVISYVLPQVISKILAGVGFGDEEDDALRILGPEYYKRQTFTRYFWGGALRSLNLTFVNPFAMYVDPITKSLEQLSKGNEFGAATQLALGYLKDQYFDPQIAVSAFINAMLNKDPRTGRRFVIEGADEAERNVSERLKVFFKEAFVPVNFRALKEAYGDMSKGDLTGAGWEVIKTFAPFKIHTHDLESEFGRYLLQYRKDFADVKSRYGILKRDANMSDQAIRDVFNDTTDALRRKNQELLLVMRGLVRLGVPPERVKAVMIERSVGKSRTDKLLEPVAVMDRPDQSRLFDELLDKEFKDTAKSKGGETEGERRARILSEEFYKRDRFIMVDDLPKN